MSTELMMVCNGRALVPATEHDHALMRATYKIGQKVKTECKKQTERSYQHHKLYFGGLIGLVKDYWEPETGLIQPIERRVVDSLLHYLKRHNISNQAIDTLGNGFLHDLQRRRALKMTAPMPASTAQIHRWIKLECGYFDVVRLPDGSLEREAKSISFAKMTQAEFNEFYKNAFSVAWRFVLSRHFDNEADAENAINRMLDMAA